MNCRNCGAAMRWHAVQQQFCCAYCSARAFPEDEAQDAVTPDGLVWASSPHEPSVFPAQRSDTEWACPVCGESLTSAWLDNQPVHACRTCRGVLLKREVFAGLVRVRRAAWSGEDETATAIQPADLVRQSTCPGCRRRMETHPYYGAGTIVIDSCGRCDLVWLDHGELRCIERAPGVRRWPERGPAKRA